MGNKKRSILLIYIASFLQFSNGQCQIGGILQLGPVPNHEIIQDIHRGHIISEATTNIDGITSIRYGGALVGTEPYLDITHENSLFVVQTNSAFAQYEETETALSISVTITFACTGGNTSPLILVINIEDTNNNYPEFIPTNEFEFVLAPPLPPGFLITGCLNEITVRDIDLTTSRIIFEIEENPYFEIEYDAAASAAAGPKLFKAQLRTSAFIRTLREPITLRITATDVDATSDPPLSTSGTIRISGDTEFEFPEEPVFSRTFYFATYTDDHQLIQLDTISLQQGFDEYVNFTLDGEYSNYFSENVDGNQVSLVVRTPLPVDVMLEKQIYLIVRADREYTSGDSATIVINLPEETPLLFERALYEGSIIDNALQLSPLVLSQGYENVDVSARIIGDNFSSFTAVVHGNLVTITMDPSTNDIFGNNSSISMPVVASTDRSETTTIVSLEIIKNDNVTPVFDKFIYTGSYDPVNGLTVEQIEFVQGFDETVSVELNGEHITFFQINESGPVIRLTSSVIPLELFEEQRITLSIEATKPRTVGANAAIIITLPSARELDFEEPTYRGTIQDNELLLQTVLLRDGFDQNVGFALSGDYSTYFNVTNVQNQVTITLSTPLSDNVITQNTVIILSLTAYGLNAVNATTSVILNIIKEDTTTPVFSQNIYHGMYRGPTNFEIENIYLTQGFDNDVSFRLDDSAHAQYFEVSNTGSIRLRSAIPENVIFNEKVLLFNVLAVKALTVGSNAAVLIRFAPELTETTVMGFSQNYYEGIFERDELTLTDNIILDIGYGTGTEFELHGDYVDYFELSSENNVLQISSNRTNILPPAVIEDNDYIILTVEARRERAVSVRTTVIIDIVKEEVVNPVFNQAFYRGVYTEENGLQFDEYITLLEGYDETVIFHLLEEQATWFSVTNENNSPTLVLDSQVPQAVLDDNNQLIFTIVALKANGVNGRAAISIDLPKEKPESLVLGFDRVSYLGSIENNETDIAPITLSEGYVPGVEFLLHGELRDYFNTSSQGATVTVTLSTPIPEQSIPDNRIIILEIHAYAPQAIPAQATIIFESIGENDDNNVVDLIFAQPYYTGSYSDSAGLTFSTPISLSDGYDTSVLFVLDGDDSQWFTLAGTANSHTLSLSSPIPAAVLANNQQLVFVIEAQRPGSTTTRATIVISLEDEYTEGLVLGFDRVSYFGSIENNDTSIAPITLSEGYVPDVRFSLHGELRDYFNTSSQGATVTVTLSTPIPEQSIPANRIIILEIHAYAPQAIPAQATIIFESIGENDDNNVVDLIFAQPYYTGSYSDSAGLTFSTPISLSDGYDTSVLFVLDGDDSQWFTLAGTANSHTLSLSSPIPAAVLANNQQLVFIIEAQRPGSTTTRATIVISLEDEYTEGLVLGFDRVSYFGSIENNETSIAPITLSEGYVPDVRFSLHGELRDYFNTSSQGATVTVTLSTNIPEQSIPANRIIILEIHAYAPQAIPAQATIIFESIGENDDNNVVDLIFAQPYYTGSYSDSAGLTFSTPISLSDGYDTSVLFVLDGDDSQWFTLAGTANSHTLSLSSPIPAAVLANNQQLVFVIEAQRPGSTTTRATIVISLEDEYTEGLVLGFDRVSYFGSIENNETSIAPITLSEGYVSDVRFSLHGELRDYFNASSQGATVTVTLSTPIPEQSIPANRIIILEIHAYAPQAIPAQATIIFESIGENDDNNVVDLIFAQPYYTGSYSDSAGLTFSTPISLSDGYDTSVHFVLDGDDSQWFTLAGTANSHTLSLSSPIPAAVLANNQQLVFVIEAQRFGSTTTRATIVISLEDEYTEGLVLGFDRVSYFGSIENNETSIAPITLSEGYVPDVRFSLHGELRDYFNTSSQGATVTVTLSTPIPEQSIPANKIIILEIHAYAPQAIPAQATIIFESIGENDDNNVVDLIFAQPYYTGSYSVSAGLTFSTPISLSDGYDTNVLFVLEGDDSQWFTLAGTANSHTLSLSSPIPAAVLANNQQLVFVIEAQRPGSTTTRATIVISLEDEYTEGLVLGFDRVSYFGSIENNETSIAPITLSEGYVPDVRFSLHGELRDYFNTSSQGATVTVTLSTPIPEQSIPANRIIILEIHAYAPQAIPAQATIIFESIGENDDNNVVDLIFAQPYYTGSYSDSAGLTFSTPISLSDGYDTSVLFVLDGDDSQWFTLAGTANSHTLSLLSPIPAAVLANNQQLVFVIEAQRPGSTTTRATIVISLEDEYTEGLVLGFDRVSYFGSIENNETSIAPITLSEGYVPDVRFSLHGELRDYFNTSSQGATVTVTLSTPIPEQSIPANRIIILEIHAYAPQAIPAQATIIFESIGENDDNNVVDLIFAQPYYTGSYSDSAGLTFSTPISLSDGYDTSVLFVLDGDDSQWFTLAGTANSHTLSLSSPIPAAVLANNQQLVFVIEAQRPGSTTTRATIVISLEDEYTEGLVLGFDRVSYFGSIENNETSIAPITLSEGYVPDVRFSLHGELRDYFNTSSQGATVTVTLSTPIPEQSIPANRIIILEIHAYAPQAIPAQATIIFESIGENDDNNVVDLIFAQPYYTGSYSDSAGLTFSTPISLSDGYDTSVLFVLDGDDSQWFTLAGTANSHTLSLSSPIPAAVLANNQQLVFVIEAQRSGSTTTRATIVISLEDDSQIGSDVSFEKVVFEGIIQNSVVSHETIPITGFNGTRVVLHGMFASLFEADVIDGEVTVSAIRSLTLPAGIAQLVLELRAGTARAVLVLNVNQSVVPVPVVTFSSVSYFVRVEITNTGLVGQVHASADNGEAVRYSLQWNNAYLQERLSINDIGELYLSAPVNSGVYTFQVVATTIFTQETGNATVYLSADAITICGTDIVMPPLIVLDRDEEEPHFNLINTYEGCTFSLSNRWPLNQTWVYVNETGLHTVAIDREHESIAFMTLSQVQVEVTLHCDTDETRVKRSLNSEPDPYDYGASRWVLADTILYNSRRSLVNLIVNDINDNAPVFLGKEQEPIAVGYPVPELEDKVLARSLAQLQATDADIGENAALLYWSLEAALAVAPSTGFVHVRDGANLENDALLRVHATDRNGQGLTGSIDIVVRLLDESNILVVTIRDAFLDNETDVLTRLSESVGYEIKVLRSVVISDGNEGATRVKREDSSATGASLQLFIYGLIDREPVSIERLMTDINDDVVAQVNIASTVSLEDHLADQEICVIPGRDTGLLAATIVLSVLLFIVTVLIAVWFFLRWRKQNYDQFSDVNSLASQNESVDMGPKPVDVMVKPRLNIEELKKSERRLQQMLDAPSQEAIVKPATSRKDSITNKPSLTDPNAHIVIQSKLKNAGDESSDDEFGERKIPRRKSVVTFNENVEKIIHVDDDDDASDIGPGFEIYKL